MSSPNSQELERLAREFCALAEVAKTLSAPLALSALLGAVMNEFADVLESTELGVIMLWERAIASKFVERGSLPTSWLLRRCAKMLPLEMLGQNTAQDNLSL